MDDIKPIAGAPNPVELQKPEYRPWVIWVLRFAAYAIPLAFLLYVLYWNFLPFGYDKTFTIDVGAPGDTSGEFYLEPSRDLSERKVAADGSTYRELNGIAYAVFKPKAVLKNAQITVSVEGDGVSIIPPYLDFDPDSVEWDYSWDFTAGSLQQNSVQTSSNPLEYHAPTSDTIATSTQASSSPELIGKAFPFDECMYFDGKSKLEMASSSDMFETGPFTVYAEWKPEDNENDGQQIIGHYNWEITQSKSNVTFWVRTNTGIKSLSYPIKQDFFNAKHSLLALYTPSLTKGTIGLYIDGINAGNVAFASSTIAIGYGNRNLTFGKNGFSNGSYLKGCLYRTDFSNETILSNPQGISFSTSIDSELLFPLSSTATTSLRSVTIHAIEK